MTVKAGEISKKVAEIIISFKSKSKYEVTWISNDQN